MSLRQRLARAYFDAVYNPLYDASTARLALYRETQERLAQFLAVAPGQRVLCAGLGTGNELKQLRAREPSLRIAGIDVSRAALVRARSKSSSDAATTSLAFMDVQSLGFRDGCFDRVLCYHVLDFVEDPSRAVSELLRVLAPGGRFVISFPSGSEDASFGAGLLSHGAGVTGQPLASRLSRIARAMLAGCIYLPLTLRRRPAVYSAEEVVSQLGSLGAVDVAIETDAIYRDHIARGISRRKGGTHGSA